MQKNYPEYHEHLEELIGRLGRELPGTMLGFGKLHEEAVADGALKKGTKELVALGIAIAVHCDGCIAYHVHDAMETGATQGEIAETVGVAVLMGGGPSVVYGAEAMEAVDQFEALHSKEAATV